MPEEIQRLVDERDVLRLSDERQRIKKELEDTRQKLREADVLARKVPALEREVERVTGVQHDLREKYNKKVNETGELEQLVREHQAELRARNDQLAAKSEAEAQRDAAQEAQRDAEEKLSDADAIARRHADDIGSLEAEIERLKEHEKHTQAFAELIGQTRDLTGRS